ncbi:virginiamycin B lyase family protein [Motilibacter rhizosphaerae]|uniref:virginiamycin B lyase family protein n=1 Tax=Motilibacter rhizosphaerae TaxID=598652 RepID=UPI0013EEB646|nr:fibronectin type III domain-containing protein [Motilibacter rhizosphaerae]
MVLKSRRASRAAIRRSLRRPLPLVVAFASAVSVVGGLASPASAYINSTVQRVNLANNSWPAQGVFDSAGNFYTVNEDGTISRISAGGILTQAWVSLPSGFDGQGITIDGSGNLYVPDWNHNKLVKVSAAGAVNPNWGTVSSNYDAQNALVDAAGNVYVTNQFAGTISKITAAGVSTPAWATLASGARPYGLAQDSAGNLYTANFGNSTISKITPAGVITPVWATLAANSQPKEMAFDSHGNLFVANFATNAGIAKVTPAGAVTNSWAPGDGGLSVVVDGQDNVYETEYTQDNVTKTTPAGVQSIFAQLPAGTRPADAKFDSSGRLFVVGDESFTVSIVAPAAAPSTPALNSATAGDQQATLDITPSTGNGTPVTGYEYSTNGGTSWATLSTSSGSNGHLTATVTGLTNGTSYSFTVRALSAAGPSSASGAQTATPYGAAGQVTISTATGGDTTATLTFAPAAPNGTPVTGYEYSVDSGTTWATLPTTTSNGTVTGTVTGLTNGTSYSVQVRSQSAGGAGAASSAVSVTPQTVPSAPSGMAWTQADGSVGVSFPAPGDNGSAISGYEDSTDGGGSWHLLTTTTSGSTVSGTIASLANGSAYSLEVRAVNGVGAGGASSALTVLPRSVASHAMGTNAAPYSGGFDAAGNFYVTNEDNGHRSITKIALDGSVTPGWATFSNMGVENLAVAPDGTIYAANSGARAISKIDPDGTVHDLWVPVPSNSNPQGIVIGPDGNVYVALYSLNEVAQITPGGTLNASWAVLGSGKYPLGLAFDQSGNLYVADNGDGTIAKIAPGGAVNASWGRLSGSSDPQYLAIDSAGNVYATNWSTNDVSKVTPAGVVTQSWGHLSRPVGIAVDSQDNVYATSYGDGSVLRINPAGVETAQWLHQAANSGTTGVAVSPTDDVYVSNDGAGTVVVAPADPSAPGAPVVTTTHAYDGRATVTFRAPTSSGHGTVTGYEYSLDGTTWHTATTTGASPYTLELTGLTNGTTYQVQIRATSRLGTGRAATASVTPYRAATPSAGTAVAGTSSVTASWTAPAPSSSITGYTVTAHPGSATCETHAASDTSCVFGAESGVSTTFTVVAHDSNGSDSVASGPSNAVTPTAPVVPAAAPANVPTTLTTDRGQIALAVPSQQITVIGTGFAPYSTAKVVVYSTPIDLGTVTTDANGKFSVPVTVPASLEAGHHTFLATGVDPQGAARAMELPVTVPPTTAGSTGANTGTQQTVLPVPAGGAITLLGAGGSPATTVTVAEGTYALDASTGTITFVPVAGFVGTAHPVTYRLTDALASVVTGTYTAVVTGTASTGSGAGSAGSSGPTGTGPTGTGTGTGSGTGSTGTGSTGTGVKPTPGGAKAAAHVSVAALAVATGPTAHATVPVHCTLTTATVGTCTVTLTATVSGRHEVIGTGTVKARAGKHVVTVQVRLNALGRALANTAGGITATATATVTPRGSHTTVTGAGTTRVALQHVTVASVYFATDSSTLTGPQLRVLAGLRRHLAGARSVTVVGHTDDRGTTAYGLTLGRARAAHVATALTAGLHLHTIVITKGEADPKASNATPAGKALNRRADITITY